jgi:hypothetical protein
MKHISLILFCLVAGPVAAAPAFTIASGEHVLGVAGVKPVTIPRPPEPIRFKVPVEPPVQPFVVSGFKSGASVLSLVQEQELAEHLTDLKRVKRIDLVGHTDDLGAEAANHRLGGQRANAVQAWLESNQVAVGNVSSQGELLPATDNKTAQGQAANRRVEVQPINQD